MGHTVRREPEFDRHQLALMLAHTRAKADLGAHGHPMSEAMSPLADPALSDGWRYVANEKPRIDYAAKALEERKEAYYKGRPEGESRAGHLWYVQKVEPQNSSQYSGQ